MGFTRDAIRHRVAEGRLYPKWMGVFAVGRNELSQRGWWVAALLTCGLGSVLSHGSAMAFCGMSRQERGIEVSVPYNRHPRRLGITVHRRRKLELRHIRVDGPIRVTNPVLTLVDFAASHNHAQVEAAVNEADRLDVIDPERLRLLVDDYSCWRGAWLLREVLDRNTFTLTDSELERWFRPIARRAGLTNLVTGARVNGFKVDFYSPELGLVIETDGLRYHRTPAQQKRDRRRDQIHTAAGLTPLRFTHYEIRFESGHVEAVSKAVANRLRS
jgi:very-short-patch-repair endonuclease